MARRLIALAFTLALPVSAFAAGAAPAAPAGGLLTPEVRESLRAILAQAPHWTSVSMRIEGGSGPWYEVSEPWTRINLNGNKDASNGFHFSGNAGPGFLSFSATPSFSNDPKRGYRLWGSGVSVNLDQFGNGYRAWGSVGSNSVSFTLDRFGDSFSVWGLNGANLSVSGFNGSVSKETVFASPIGFNSSRPPGASK